MTHDADSRFTSHMLLAVRQGGMAARLLQGKVLNEGKSDATQMPHDDDALRLRRAALTVVDQVVQEIILIAAAEVIGGNSLVLDAEEETSSCSRFAQIGSSVRSLVIDPIDGTLEYVSGRNSYSICLGLVECARMRAAIVYFPARDVLYMLDESGDPYQIRDFSRNQGQGKSRLDVQEGQASKRVYINGRVPQEIQQRLQRRGLEVIDDTDGGIGAPDCILSCLTGEAIAYVAHTRQMRDILLGPVLGACPGGFAADWDGKDLLWPQVGRVPRAVFGRKDAWETVIPALRS